MSGHDAKYFTTTKKGEIHELKEELNSQYKVRSPFLRCADLFFQVFWVSRFVVRSAIDLDAYRLVLRIFQWGCSKCGAFAQIFSFEDFRVGRWAARVDIWHCRSVGIRRCWSVRAQSKPLRFAVVARRALDRGCWIICLQLSSVIRWGLPWIFPFKSRRFLETEINLGWTRVTRLVSLVWSIPFRGWSWCQ